MHGHTVLGRSEGEYNETDTDKVKRNERTQVMCINQAMEKQGQGQGRHMSTQDGVGCDTGLSGINYEILIWPLTP